MSEFDALRTYRRMFACPDGQMVCWWYFGNIYAQVSGYPEMLVTSAETVMVYRTETLSADRFRIFWWEIGCFRDPSTGEVGNRWLNPLTGVAVETPRLFEEGPTTITVSRDGAGVALEIAQPHATIRSTAVTWKRDGDRVFFNQCERKVRGLPRADGSLPDSASTDAAEAVTNLSIYASLKEIEASEYLAQCSGSYTFDLTAPAPWMGFGPREGVTRTRGRMEKTPLNHVLNPSAWQRLQRLLPNAFNGDRLNPRWV